MGLAPKVASRWFPASERPLCTSIIVGMMPVAMTANFILSQFVISERASAEVYYKEV